MTKFEPIKLNDQFKDALKELHESSINYFVTGRAGTGKSTLLQLFKKTTNKKAAVLAPTGIAALNVGGQTIHSFFRFPSRPLKLEDINRRRNRKIYELLELLIIDEISMVRADLFDAMDRFLRINRDRPDLPFGGVQVILFGDIFQLPPVVSSIAEKTFFSSYYRSPFFFDAKVFEEGFGIQLIELTEVFRQKDAGFKRILDDIRLNHVDWDTMQTLNERAEATLPEDTPVINLCTTNAIADRINKEALNKLDGICFDFLAKVHGNYKSSRFPTDEILQFKEGSQVMFIRNDHEKMFVNGTIGVVSEIDYGKIKVEYTDTKGRVRNEEITPQKWELMQYQAKENQIETKVVGTFKQYPLKLAWAISIHKSQGKSFDYVKIHLGRGAFESGQTYVALSRCRTLEGLILSKPLRPRDIFIDERLLDFQQRLLM